MQPTQPKNKKFMWATAALISLLVISNVAWGWMYTEGRNDMQQQLDYANKKLDKKQVDSTVAKETKATTPKVANKSNAMQYREIPELGVKYVLDNDTKDLTYSYRGDDGIGSVGWSTISLSNKSITGNYSESTGHTGSCNSGDYARANWTDITKGQHPAHEAYSIAEKQVGSKKFSLSIPDGGRPLIDPTCRDDSLLDKADAAIKKAFNSLQPIN